MLRGWEHRHIHSDFRDNADSGKGLDTWCRHKKVKLRKIFLSSCQNQRFQIEFAQFKAVHVGTDDAELFSLFFTHHSVHSSEDFLVSRFHVLGAESRNIRDSLRRVVQNTDSDGGGCLAEHIREHIIQFKVGDSQAVLGPVFLASGVVREFPAVTEQIPKLAVAGIMYMLLIRGGGTKSMMVVLFLSLVLGLILAKDRKAYGDEMLKGLRESMVCVICVAFFMAGLLSALLFSVVLGVIEPSVLFSDDSPVASGMIGMANVAIVAFLIQIPDKSGALDAFAGWIVSRCKSIRSAELVAYFLAMSGCIATHSSTNTIVFFSPFVKQLMSDYKDEADPCRSANILDGVACGTNGLIPHGNPALVITGVATSVAGVPASFSFLNFIGYTFHCWGLLINVY